MHFLGTEADIVHLKDFHWNRLQGKRENQEDLMTEASSPPFLNSTVYSNSFLEILTCAHFP